MSAGRLSSGRRAAIDRLQQHLDGIIRACAHNQKQVSQITLTQVQLELFREVYPQRRDGNLYYKNIKIVGQY